MFYHAIGERVILKNILPSFFKLNAFRKLKFYKNLVFIKTCLYICNQKKIIKHATY